MSSSPEKMSEALRMHNELVRKAQWDNVCSRAASACVHHPFNHPSVWSAHPTTHPPKFPHTAHSATLE
eukprot:365219-Chlamydomonas_euryale.AAC.48